MFHPKSWKKLTDGLYQVNEALVKNGRFGWACSECKGEPFRIGGRKQFPCKHVLFTLRKEEELQEIKKERRNKISIR